MPLIGALIKPPVERVVRRDYYEASFDLIYEDKYIKASKNCSYDELLLLLDYRKSFPSKDGEIARDIQKHVIDYFQSNLVRKVREKYNYLKHRGSYHFHGLGINNEEFCFGINDFSPKMLKRRELNMKQTLKEIIEYDKTFIKYFEYIFKTLIPTDYLDPEIKPIDFINYHRKTKDYLKNK